MLARIHSLFLFFLFALCVSASVVSRTGPQGASCNANTGNLQCCNSLQDADSPAVKTLAGLLGIVVGLTAQVGLTCNPIDIIGIGSNQCNQQAVCCSGDSFSGLIVLGCTPINVNV